MDDIYNEHTDENDHCKITLIQEYLEILSKPPKSSTTQRIKTMLSHKPQPTHHERVRVPPPIPPRQPLRQIQAPPPANIPNNSQPSWSFGGYKSVLTTGVKVLGGGVGIMGALTMVGLFALGTTPVRPEFVIKTTFSAWNKLAS